jgi:hypothetical protein
MAGRSRYLKPGSRADATLPSTQSGPDDASIVYLPRRLLPLPDQITIQSTYLVKPGDRTDLVSARLLGDPLLYWLIADANGASDPASLSAVPGRSLQLPAPLGQPVVTLDQPTATEGAASGSTGGRNDDGTGG